MNRPVRFLINLLICLGIAGLTLTGRWARSGQAVWNQGRELKTHDETDNSIVSWDRHSIKIAGERRFIQAGEFHPWRLPVVALWSDILQKMAAAGLNTVSIYVHWGLVNPSNGTTDWSGFRSLAPFFEAARSAGLFVIVRPGPYINAETTAGGIPGWVTTMAGPLRTNSSEFENSWRQYWDEVVDQIVPYQIGLPNGTIIAVQVENEYLSDAHSSRGQPSGKDGYMSDLAEVLRARGITVPLTVNDAGMDKNFATGMGSVDIYGFDSYPQSFDCSSPNFWKPVTTSYKAYQDSLNLDSPLFIPEFQGGAYDAWGATGYEDCRKLTGSDFESVFYLNNLASNIKMISYYMLYGGTNWGYLAFPGTYTSYDYGSAISEDRTVNEKFTELKRQSFFLRSTEQFYLTDVVGDSDRNPNYFDSVEDASVGFVTELRNPLTGAGFYIVRARNSTSTDSTRLRLKVTTSVGAKHLPPITLLPRQSRLLVTDYETSCESRNSNRIKLLYTTSSVLLSACIGGHDILYLFSDGSVHPNSQDAKTEETSSIKLPEFENGYGTGSYPNTGGSARLQVSSEPDETGYREIIWQIREQDDILTLATHSSLVIMTSKEMAGQVWNPILAQLNPSAPPTSILVWGPWLVRNASIKTGRRPEENVLRINGDLEEDVKKEIIIYAGGLQVGQVEWNGKKIKNLSKSVGSNFLSFFYHPNSFKRPMEDKEGDCRLDRVGSRINFRNLEWRYRDSLPEIKPDFVDEKWADATIKQSNNPYKKLYGKYYLYGCDYGFCHGATLWRGHFDHQCQTLFIEQKQSIFAPSFDKTLGINLTLAGGDFFAGSVWLNDVFLGSVPDTRSKSDRTLYGKSQMSTFQFPPGSLKRCGSNVITVVQDSMGMDQTESGFSDTIKHPRGILGYKFEGDDGAAEKLGELSWKVQGHLGGFHQLPDPKRGIYNENGFYGVRSGWHLPLYNDRNGSADWRLSSPIKHGLTTAGIGFYHTTFDLDFQPGYDVMVSFRFGPATLDEGRYRVEFWVNGWHMGKVISHLGPQTRFPVHEGILNYQGSNKLALTLWALDPQGAQLSSLEFVVDQIFEGGIGPISLDNLTDDQSPRPI